MNLLIDIRERDLWDNLILKKEEFPNINFIKQTLDIGDIIIKDLNENTLIIIERKSISDLLASIKDGRYNEQSLRLMNNGYCSPHHIIYLIEGNLSIYSKQERQIVNSAITSLNVFKGFSIVLTNSLIETSELILSMTDKIRRSLKNDKKLYYKLNENANNNVDQTNKDYCNVVKTVKKENVTKDNISEIMLMQIPGISSTMSKVILEKYDNLNHFLTELNLNNNCIDNLSYMCNGKERKVSKKCIESIKNYLL